REQALQQELTVLEAVLDPPRERAPERPDLTGLSVLYVGGRPSHVAGLRAITEEMSADFLHHDGAEDHGGPLARPLTPAALAGLIGPAAVAFFPVDCVSHAAAPAVKRLCGQAGKPFVPLRSAGLSSFLAALCRLPPARRPVALAG